LAKILVTGGAGYIGSHVCKALRDVGHEPVTFDNLSTGWRDAVKFGPLEEGDLRDSDRIGQVLRAHEPVAVVHLAALSDIGQSMREAGLYWHNNVLGTVNLLEAMATAGVELIVFSSTCAIYGAGDGAVLTEDSEIVPNSNYGATKWAAETALRHYDRTKGLRSVALRYFNVAGADASLEIGEFHRPESHLIPLALQAMNGDRPPLTVNGLDYPTPDGTCIRDYIHVSDLAQAHLDGLAWLERGEGTEAFNLGTREGHSVLEILQGIEKVTGRPVPHVKGPRRSGDAALLVSGSDRASQILGWNAQGRGLDEMIDSAWRWHLQGSYRN
jgi:UDP-glucose 4-epimerase